MPVGTSKQGEAKCSVVFLNCFILSCYGIETMNLPGAMHKPSTLVEDFSDA